VCRHTGLVWLVGGRQVDVINGYIFLLLLLLLFPLNNWNWNNKKCYFSSFWGFGFLVGLYISFFYVSVRLFVYIYISLYLLVLLSSISFVALVFSSPFCFVPFLLLVCVVWVIKTNWEIYRRRRRSVVLYGRQPTSRFSFCFLFFCERRVRERVFYRYTIHLKHVCYATEYQGDWRLSPFFFVFKCDSGKYIQKHNMSKNKKILRKDRFLFHFLFFNSREESIDVL
jgi:CDP-diglyceride synthetase